MEGASTGVWDLPKQDRNHGNQDMSSPPSSECQTPAYTWYSMPSTQSSPSNQQLESSPTPKNIRTYRGAHLNYRSYQDAEGEPLKSYHRGNHVDPCSSPSQSKLVTVHGHSTCSPQSNNVSCNSSNPTKHLLEHQMFSKSPWQHRTVLNSELSDGESVVAELRQQNVSNIFCPAESVNTETDNENPWPAGGTIKDKWTSDPVHELPCQQSLHQEQQPQRQMLANQLLSDIRRKSLSECLKAQNREAERLFNQQQLVKSVPSSFVHSRQPIFSQRKQTTHVSFSQQDIIPAKQTESNTYYKQQQCPVQGHNGDENKMVHDSGTVYQDTLKAEEMQPVSTAHGYMVMQNMEQTKQANSVLHNRHNAKERQTANECVDNIRGISTRRNSSRDDLPNKSVSDIGVAKQSLSKSPQSANRNSAMQHPFRSESFRLSVDSACTNRHTVGDSRSKDQNKEVSNTNLSNPQNIPGQEKIQGPRLLDAVANNLIRRSSISQNGKNLNGRSFSAPNESSRKEENPTDLKSNTKSDSFLGHVGDENILQHDQCIQGKVSNITCSDRASQAKKRLQFGCASLSKLSSALGKRQHIDNGSEISSAVEIAKSENPDDENQPSDASPSQEEDAASANKKQRFLKTAHVLEKSGLMDITLKTAAMLQNSHRLQMEIDQVRAASKKLLISVLNNPENSRVKEEVLSKLNRLIGVKSQGNESSETLPDRATDAC